MFHVKHEKLGLAYPQAMPKLEAFVAWLAGAGIERGLLGPREVDKLWDRHVANCAAVAELIPENAVVYDVGSGAGLPGIVLAIVRPDIKVSLIEPLLRRATFLSEVVADLDLGNQVQVIRGRAEEVKLAPADVVTARAVAPLAKLLEWTLPLTRKNGLVLAMKGSTAEQEILDAKSKLKGKNVEIIQCGLDLVDPPTTVVQVTC